MAVRIQFRRGTSGDWASANPVLADGELGFENDTKIIKFGDGVTAWNDLPVAAAGDITAVLPGTGLQGGATSGEAQLSIDSSYVVTAAAIDAAGDLIVGAGPDTYARLPIGSDGSVLVADSNQSVGVRWAAPSATGGAVVPTGTILPFAGSATSGTLLFGGFLLCDGAAVPRSTYAELFNVLTISGALPYGIGDGSSTFNLPDLRGHVPAVYKSGDVATPNGFGSFGKQTGAVSTTMVGGTPTGDQVQVPGHAHAATFTGSDGQHSHTGIDTGIQDASHKHEVGVTGGSHLHSFQYFINTGSGTNGFGLGLLGSGSTGNETNQTVGGSSAGTHSHTVSVGNQDTSHRHSISITSSGTHGHSVNITNSLAASAVIPRIQPSLTVNYIIKT